MTNLSVVIPCYNSAKNFNRGLYPLLESPIVNEIVVVDDSSNDNSAEIIANLKTRFKKLRFIQLEKNYGAGHARNVGANECTSDFLLFLDSDDVLNPKLLDSFSRISNLEKFDLILFKYEIFDAVTKTVEPMYKDDENIWSQICGNTAAKSMKLSDCQEIIQLINYPWIRFVSRKFFIRNKLKFSETKVNNDILFHWSSLIKSNDILLLNLRGVRHIVNEEKTSITQNFTEDRFQLFKVLEELELFLIDQPEIIYNDFYSEFLYFKIDMLDWVWDRLPDKLKARFVMLVEESYKNFDKKRFVQHYFKRPFTAINSAKRKFKPHIFYKF